MMNDHSPPEAIKPATVQPRLRRWNVREIALFVLGTALLGTLGALALDGLSERNLKLAMCVATVVPLVGGWVADRKDARTAGIVLTALLASMTVTTTVLENSGKARRLFVQKRVFAWNVFHYVLGTKYFDELGYFDFYKGVLLADADGERYFSGLRNTRDLHTYETIRITRALREARAEGIRERFSDRRWEEFQRDLHAIQRQRPPQVWQGPVADLGFNPSPAWLILHRPLLNAVDISNRNTLMLLCAAQFLLFAAMFIAAWWAFGFRATLLCVLWLNLYMGNDGRLVGGYFHYDFLCLTVIAVALYRKGHWLPAAPILAYAAMMRGFPGLLALHPGICIIKALWRRRWPARRYIGFITALVICCGVIVGLGCTTKRGPQAWLDWREKISLHAEWHPSGRQRVGLEFLFAHDVERYGWNISQHRRRGTLEENQVPFRIAQAALLALFLAAMIRRNDTDGMLMALGVVVCTMVMSRYYASAWILMFTWLPLDRRKIGNLISSLALFAMLMIYYLMDGASSIHRYHVFVQGLVLYSVVIAVWFLARDLNGIGAKRPTAEMTPSRPAGA